MKTKKVMALLLTAAMMASFAGCAKVKSADMDTFINACEESDADEVDADDLSGIDVDDLFHGFYCVMDEDDIEDLPTEALMMLKLYDLDLDIDPEDIDQMAIYARYSDLPNSIDDVEEYEDLCEVDFDFVGAAQITLLEPANMDDMVDAVDDLLDHIHLEHEDLSNDEFKTSKNGLQLMLRIDIADLAAALADSDAYDIIMDTADEDDASQIGDVLDEITGEVVLGVYIENENIVIIVGGCLNADYSNNVEEMIEYLNLPNPEDVPSNQAVIDAIIDYVDDYASILNSYVSAYDDDNDYDYYGF